MKSKALAIKGRYRMIDWFFYNEPVQTSEMRDVLIRACVDDEGQGTPSRAVSGLLTAYLALAEEREDPLKDFVSGADAETVYMVWFEKCYNHFADWEYDRECCSHWWPDSMPYGEKEAYPKALLRDIARVMASGAVSQTRARVEYYKSMKSADLAEGANNG